MAVTNRSGAKSIYVGIIESDVVLSTKHDCLQVLAYVDEPLVRDLAAASRLTGRIFIRETNTSVPLTFARVPRNVSLNIERKRRERRDDPRLPATCHFDPGPALPVLHCRV